MFLYMFLHIDSLTYNIIYKKWKQKSKYEQKIKTFKQYWRNESTLCLKYNKLMTAQTDVKTTKWYNYKQYKDTHSISLSVSEEERHNESQ